MAAAIVMEKHGGPEVLVLRQEPDPTAGPGEILIRNTAIGLNFIDIYQRKGLYPVDLPAIPGSEGAGVVEAVGDGVETFAPGDRVAYISTHGAYAALTSAPAVMAAKIQADIKEETAAALFLKGLTVHMLVRQVYPLAKGDTALVYAAAGGVGSLLCQWANHIGARVIGVVGSAEKTGLAKFHGATNVINRKEVDNIAAEVRNLTNGKGVNVAYDSIGAATFEASLDALALRGMMVSYGNASGPAPAIAPLDLTRRGSISLARPTLFHYATPDRLPAMAEDLFSMLASGALKAPTPKTFALKDAADAQAFLESGESTGPIILKP
ncbi:MAG: quinone oxidoreductase [Pseudomonadota bacterium]